MLKNSRIRTWRGIRIRFLQGIGLAETREFGLCAKCSFLANVVSLVNLKMPRGEPKHRI